MKSVADTRDIPVPGSDSLNNRAYFFGLFTISFSSLLLELALTRLFSVILFYHLAFLAISIAMLGVGAGGVLAYSKKETLSRYSTADLISFACAANAISVFVVLWTILRIPVSLEVNGANLSRLALIYALTAVPFLFTGFSLSVVFARRTSEIGLLYGADLLGGAAACLLTVPALNYLGAPNSVLFSGLTLSVASGILSKNFCRRFSIGLAATFALVIAFNQSGQLIDVIYAKGVQQPGTTLFSKWNAISRVEVRGRSNRRIVIDADAASGMANEDPNRWHGTASEKRLMAMPTSVVNVVRPEGRYAVIGPGGGEDILRALGNGSPHVTGIEINPLIATEIMRTRFGEFTRHLYDRPDVEIQVADGRSWIRGSSEKFDVIQMTLVDTWASTAAGALALSENYLYTVDSFREYLDHLTPDGFLAITRWEFAEPREALRIVSIAKEALRQHGTLDCTKHFIIISRYSKAEKATLVQILIKKTPVNTKEEEAAFSHVRTTSAGLEPLKIEYSPALQPPSPFRNLIVAGDAYVFSETYPFDISPLSDNRPFFFFTTKPGQILRWDPTEMDWKLNLGVLVLRVGLLVSVFAVLLFLILPLVIRRVPMKGNVFRLLYFSAIGLGYIIVEMALIQRFILFLGHPTYALTVVVFLMLLSSGLGSWFSRRWSDPLALMRASIGWILLILAFYSLGLPGILTRFVGAPLPFKLFLSFVLLTPLGFGMGIPFPTGLRALVDTGDRTVEWAWAMNSAAGVLGSVAAMVLAIQFGLSLTLVFGALAYLSTAAISLAFRCVKT